MKIRILLSVALLILFLSFTQAYAQSEHAETTPKLQKLITRLSSEKPKERGVAAYELGEMGGNATATVPELLKLIEDNATFTWKNPELQKSYETPTTPAREAITALGKIKDPRAVEPLVAILLRDANDRKYGDWYLTSALISLGDKRALKPLLLTMSGRRASLKRLTELDPDWRSSEEAKSAIPELVKSLEETGKKDINKSMSTIQILGELKSDKAIDTIIDILKDENESNYVRRISVEALAKIGGERVKPALIAALSYKKGDLAYPGVKRGRGAPAPSYGVRGTAARALGDMGATEAVDQIIPLLKDIRWIVEPALNHLDPEWQKRDSAKKMIPYFIAGLKNQKSEVRLNSIAILKELADSESIIDLIIESFKYMPRKDYYSIAQRIANELYKLDQNWRKRNSAREVALEMLEALQSKDSNTLGSSLRVIGLIGDKRAMSFMVDALKDADKKSEILYAMQSMGTFAVEPLIEVLKKGDNNYNRASAAELLGGIGDSRAVEPLISALEDPDKSVRSEVAKALANIGDSRAITSLHDLYKRTQGNALQALEILRGDTYDLDELLVMLKSNNSTIKYNAFKSIRNLGDPRAVEPLISFMKGERWDISSALNELDPNWRERASVKAFVPELINSIYRGDNREEVTLLGAIGDRRALGELFSLITDESGSYRRILAIAIDNILNGSKVKPGEVSQETTDDLIAALKSSNKNLRHYAILSLGKIGDKKAVEPLIEMINDKGYGVALKVCDALGGIGDARAIDPLIETLKKSKDYDLHTTIILALVNITAPDPRKNEKVMKIIRRLKVVEVPLSDDYGDAAFSMDTLNEKTAEILIETLQGDYETVIVHGRIAALLSKTDPEDIEAIITTLKNDDNQEVLKNAIWTLLRVNDSRVNSAFIDTLKNNKIPNIRALAARHIRKNDDASVVDALLSALKDENSDVRKNVVITLGILRDKRAVEPLIEIVKSNQGNVAQVAATALRKIGDKRAVPALIEALSAKNFNVKRTIVKELGRFRDPRAAKPLIELMSSANKTLLSTIKQALKRISSSSFDEADKVAYLIATGDWYELTQVGEAAIAPLLELLNNKKSTIRREAAGALGAIKSARAFERLAPLLMDDDWGVRLITARALANIDADWREKAPVKQVVAEFTAALNADEWHIREDAAWGLGNIGGADVVNPLITAATKSDDRGVRMYAVEALGKVGGKNARLAVVAALDDNNWSVRWLAAKAIDSNKWEVSGKKTRLSYLIAAQKWSSDEFNEFAEEAIAPLIALLNNKNRYVRDGVARLLDSLDKNWRERAEAKDKKPDYIAMLSDSDAGSRIEAVAALGKIADPAFVELFIKALGDTDPAVRENAVVALGKIGDKRAATPISALLKDDDNNVQMTAVTVLGELAEPSSVEPLIAELSGNVTVYYDRFETIQKKAIDALVKIGAAAVEPLIAGAKDKNNNSGLRSLAVVTLGKIRDKRAIKTLVALMEDEAAPVSYAAPQALKEIGWEPETVEEKVSYHLATYFSRGRWYGATSNDRHPLMLIGALAVEPLIKILESKNNRERSARAAVALGEIGDKRATEALGKALERQNPAIIISRAAEALGKLGDARAVEPLLKLLNLGAESNVYPAAKALGELGDPRAVEPLINILNTVSSNARVTVINALGKLGDKRAVEPLIAMLEQEEGRGAHLAAVQALGKLGDPRAIKLLMKIKDLKNNQYDRFYEALLTAFSGIKSEETYTYLAENLRGKNKYGVKKQIEILNKVNPDWTSSPEMKKIIPEFVGDLQSKNNYSREAAAEFLIKLGEPALDDLLMTLADADESHKLVLCWIIGQIGGVKAEEALIKLTSDSSSDVRISAIWSLKRLATPNAVEAIRRVAESDESIKVRKTAKNALKKLDK